MTTKTLNLDKIAAMHAQNMVKKAKIKEKEVKKAIETLERLVTKTLGVLQEQGIYAMVLFLYSRSSDEAQVAPIIRNELFNIIKKFPGFDNNEIQDDPENALSFFSENILGNLDNLFLLRDLYEQTLIYARFGAKAAGY